MGRPRKRRREEEGVTEYPDGSARGSEGKAVGPPHVGLQDPDYAPVSGYEPGLGVDDFHFSGNSFEESDMFLFGAGKELDVSNGERFQFDLPEGPASNLQQGFTDWDFSQDLGQLFSTFADVPLQLHTPPNIPDELSSNDITAGDVAIGCSCLSNLYSMLAKFQSLPEPSFPYSMGALRSAAALGHDVVTCHDCSQAHNTAIQNSMLLGTLLQLLIMEYAKLLKHIDEKSKQVEKIAFRFGDSSSPFDIRHTGGPDCPMAINVELSGDEWRTLARKAISQEVVGSCPTSRGLTGLIQEMRDRQASWRERLSERQCRGLHSADQQRSSETPGHQCVQNLYIDNLERALEALGL